MSDSEINEALEETAFVAARLAAYRIPADVIGLLVHGDGRGTVPPGALENALLSLRKRMNPLEAAAPEMAVALEPFAEFSLMMDKIDHAVKTPDDAVIHPGLTVGNFRKAGAVLAKARRPLSTGERP